MNEWFNTLLRPRNCLLRSAVRFANTCLPMTQRMRTLFAGLPWLALAISVSAQIDPARRELIQLGYNQHLEGRGPIAAYGFYYRNEPHFLQRTNLTLRLAIAPVYLDSELGIAEVLGPNTGLGFGLAGGGFADSHSEVRLGNHERSESFLGHGGEISASLYHLFNPASRIPLHAVLRLAGHYSAYADDSHTDDAFAVPSDQSSVRIRTGLRWGGREPLMLPELAMEVSAWYEGEFRNDPGHYGYAGDRELHRNTHLYWTRALFTYTLPETKHNFGVNFTAGTGSTMDRLSAYRLGGNLPLSSEFPLSLPGYYHQELTAKSFVLFGGSYSLPLDSKQNWRVGVSAASARVQYLPGLEQPGHWNSGVGGGLVYRSPSDSWQVAFGYGYGIDAVRNGNRGAHSLSLLVQFDLDSTRRRLFDPGANLDRSRGLESILRNIFR